MTAISSLQVVQTSNPEKCDGTDFDLEELAAAFPECQDENVEAVGNVDCGGNCQEFIPREGEPMCCLPKGADCPADGAFPRCCHEYTNPEDEQHCSNPFLPPGEEPPPDSGGSKCH